MAKKTVSKEDIKPVLSKSGTYSSINTVCPIRQFVLGDNHLKRVDPLGIIDESGRNTRLIDKIDSLSYFITKALSNKATHITFLGDIYDAVNPPEFLRKAFWDALHPAITAKVNITIILGNHDTTGNVSNFLGESLILPENVRIVKDTWHLETLTIQGVPQTVVYIPYAKKEVLARWFSEIKEQHGHVNIMFGHFEIEGAELAPDNSKLTDGFSKDDIGSMADIIMLGHIHKFQEFRKGFNYVGSMVKCDFGELTNRKVFSVVDIEVKDLKPLLSYVFVDIPQRPMHQVILKEDDPNNLYLAETMPPEYLVEGVLLKFILEGSDMWLRSIDRAKLKKRFPKAIRVLFDAKKVDTDRQAATVLTSNMVDRIHAKVNEKSKDKDHLNAGLLIGKEVQEIDL